MCANCVSRLDAAVGAAAIGAYLFKEPIHDGLVSMGLAPERHPLAPLADQMLELVFDAGAEEVADEAALFRSVVAVAHVGHASAKQRAAARRVRQCAFGVDRRARVHATDVAAEGAVPALGVVREVEVGVNWDFRVG